MTCKVLVIDNGKEAGYCLASKDDNNNIIYHKHGFLKFSSFLTTFSEFMLNVSLFSRFLKELVDEYSVTTIAIESPKTTFKGSTAKVSLDREFGMMITIAGLVGFSNCYSIHVSKLRSVVYRHMKLENPSLEYNKMTKSDTKKFVKKVLKLNIKNNNEVDAIALAYTFLEEELFLDIKNNLL